MQDKQWERHSRRRETVALMLSRTKVERGHRKPARLLRHGKYEIASYRDRFGDEGGDMKWRSIWIEIHHGRNLVGVAETREWQLPPFPSPVDFWQLADDINQEDGQFAEVIASYWPDFDFPSDFGNLLNFVRLAIDTKKDAGRVALRLLGDFLSLEAGRRVSVMVLKAFPLEFEAAEAAGDKERSRQFDHRLAAMLRMYGRALKATPFPDQDRYPGYMWRRFRWCPPPLPQASLDWLDEW